MLLLGVAVLISTHAAAESNLDYWLEQAKPAKPDETKSANTQPISTDVRQAEDKNDKKLSGFRRDDALPGVIEFSDGCQLAGGIFMTRDKPLTVWVEREKRWLRVPPAAVLSISAVLLQEEMKLRWRWKAMGEPEKVYTGKSYPFRRFQWQLHLADGSSVRGVIKGQPVWIETRDRVLGPFILHERAKGKIGQTLKDHVYIRKIVISRKMMDKVREAILKNQKVQKIKEITDYDAH